MRITENDSLKLRSDLDRLCCSCYDNDININVKQIEFITVVRGRTAIYSSYKVRDLLVMKYELVRDHGLLFYNGDF